MKRLALHIVSWVILVAGLWAAYYTYCVQEGNNKANRAVTLLGENKLEEAMAEANAAMRLIPDDALAYYVRGVARLRLIIEQQAPHELADCKKDLERALGSSQNADVRSRAEQALSVIVKHEAAKNAS